jgi:lysophospholipase L1-like esterase
MKNIFALSACLLVELIAPTSYAQKRIVILGSSTAAGNGASIDSSWAIRLQASFRKNTTDGIDTTIDNRAYPGYITYKGMPSDYVMPVNRLNPEWAPDPLRNVSWVLSQNAKPDIVILSYASNDANLYPDYSEKETMDNLRFMFQSYNSAGIRCFVTGTQPRNDMTVTQRTMLRELRDSIINTFKIYSIVFWDDLVTSDGLNMLKPEVNSGDGIHPNDLGHRLLFQRVAAKNIFSTIGAPLPLTLKKWQAIFENNTVILNWSTANEELNTSFEVQRSTDGKNFQMLHMKSGNGHDADYFWTDPLPLNGKSFYRLKINEATKTSYSGIIPIINDAKQLVTSFYADASQLHLQFNSHMNQTGTLTLINSSGTIIKKLTVNTGSSNTTVSVPISELPTGEYFLRVITSAGTAVETFIRMK